MKGDSRKTLFLPLIEAGITNFHFNPKRFERPFCQQCGYPFPALDGHDSTFLCAHCVDRKWYFKWARSGYRTEGQVLDAIVGFKYRDEYYQRGRLVRWLTETFDRHTQPGEWHALVPVPLYHRRRRERGFNQAHEMARGLAGKRKIPLLDCLYRYRETVSQTIKVSLLSTRYAF